MKYEFIENNTLELMMQIELCLRSKNDLTLHIWEELARLTDWEYRIVQDFMLRVNMSIQANDMNFVYKRYKSLMESNKLLTFTKDKNLDLVIAMTRRDKLDVSLTDAWNRLIVPTGLNSQVIEIWGMQVTQARNFAVEQALKLGAKYLLFIDDDIIAPNNGLLKLYEAMKNNEELHTVSGLYYKKVEPLQAPFESHKDTLMAVDPDSPDLMPCDKICGMGFCLIDLEKITAKVSLPLFWEFGAPDGYWSMGEDAFYTMNVVEHTGVAPVVDMTIKCLHMDKTWKKIYGERDTEVIYATGIWDTGDINSFERLRVPPAFPLILVCIPTRRAEDPIAVDLENLLLLRGYRTELFRIHGKMVDDARQICAEAALQKDAQFVLFIDDDVIPPQDGLVNLLKHYEKIDEPCVISGNYCLKGDPANSIHTQLNEKDIVTDLDRVLEYDMGDLFESNWLIGLGFALIDTDIFKQARRPYFVCYSKGKDTDVNEDAHFTELCFQNGYKVYVDPKIQCLHIDFANQTIYGEVKDNKKYAGHDPILKFKQG